MNESDTKAKQQIVDKIKSTTNILVTVSRDPSVDELSAALGLTVLLNKLDKHATAIFSGAFPPAITFLDPDKVFENTADSLRDFIIALDKEKADHLRYKVEGDVVKIFITPYRTTITDKDLEFTQGDYNIELVLALGVANQEHLDTALAANGQILHDVTIATFSAGEQSSQLGSMDWRDAGASCLSEMVAVISDALKTDKTLLDKQIATALLTGIVSATDRFSNPLTTSRVMAMSAQLMAAGADQQLIAAKLQESHEVNSLPSASVDKIATSTSTENVPIEPIVEQPAPPSDSLKISHDLDAVDDVEPEPELEPEPEPIKPTTLPPAEYIDLPTPVISPKYITTKPTKSDVVSPKSEVADEPLLGGILNSTSDQAAEDARRELDTQQNKTILEHSYLSGSDSGQTAPINSATQKDDTEIVDIFSEAPSSTIPPQADPIAPTSTPEVNLSPLPEVSAVGLPLPPPLPDFSTLPPTPAPASPDSNNKDSVSTTSTLPPPNPNDPSQFQIPI